MTENNLIFVSKEGKVVKEGSPDSAYQLSGEDAKKFLAGAKGADADADADDSDSDAPKSDNEDAKAKRPAANKARRGAQNKAG